MREWLLLWAAPWDFVDYIGGENAPSLQNHEWRV
jgi:hypothetical protein